MSAAASRKRRQVVHKLDKVATAFLAQPAQFEKMESQELERRFVQEYGVLRRMALATLTRSGTQLYDAIIDDRAGAVAFAEVCERAHEYAARLKDFAGFMEIASTRLRIAICFREDGLDVLEEGKRRFSNAAGEVRS